MTALLALLTLATAAPESEVRAAFDEYVRLSNAYDPAVAAMYADDAKLVQVRDGDQRMEMYGAQWKQALAMALPVAKERGETTTYDKVKVKPQGEGFRVTAVRRTSVKCITDPSYYADFAKVDGQWRIVAEYAESVSLSLCKPDKELAKSLQALAAGIQPHLPIDLDPDTRLEGVEVQRSALIYRQRFHTIGAAEMDLSKLRPMLKQMAIQNICTTPEIRAITEQGGTVRYSYVDRDGVLLGNTDVHGGMCSLIK